MKSITKKTYVKPHIMLLQTDGLSILTGSQLYYGENNVINMFPGTEDDTIIFGD